MQMEANKYVHTVRLYYRCMRVVCAVLCCVEICSVTRCDLT